MAKRGKVKNKHSKRKDKREDIQRPIRYRNYKQFFLIVCEDEKTEPFYFDSFKDLFPENTLFLKTVGIGRDPLGVVNQSISERNTLQDSSKKEIDFVWVVFDKDDADGNTTKIQNFEKAFLLAQTESINVAYSNEVFELWLLLHFTDVDAEIPLPRKQVYENLEQAIQNNKDYKDFEYQHGKKDVIEVIQKIGNEEQALQRASDLLDHHKGKAPINTNPSTKVCVLVKELRDWIQYHNWTPEK